MLPLVSVYEVPLVVLGDLHPEEKRQLLDAAVVDDPVRLVFEIRLDGVLLASFKVEERLLFVSS